jgi:hypothetical protein
MENINLEDGFIKMTKDEVAKIEHQTIMFDTILRSKDTLVLSGWWLSIPLFVIAMLLMKSVYMPNTSLISNIHEFKGGEKYISFFIFVIIPLFSIILNINTIRKINYFSVPHERSSIVEVKWFNHLLIVFSMCVLIIYFL